MIKTNNPYLIPEYSYIQFISENQVDKEQFLWIIKIMKFFPQLHKFLVEISWKPQLPDFYLPTVISANIVKYIEQLAIVNNTKDIKDLFNYLENIYISWTKWEKDIAWDFIISYLYLLEDYLPIVENILPEKLKTVYYQYFK